MAGWSHESEFVFQGRTYQVKVSKAGSEISPDNQGHRLWQERDTACVVRQGKGLAVFQRTDDPAADIAMGGTVEGSWSMIGGRPLVFRAAARHLVAHRV